MPQAQIAKKDKVEDVILEDGAAIVMENQETAESYYKEIVKQWNKSVDGILQMAKKLSVASGSLHKDEWALLQKQLNDNGVLSYANQKKMVALGQSKTLYPYYRECLKKNEKPALPNNWTTLYQLQQLNSDTFDLGIKSEIIGINTTSKDVNQLKDGSHERLPGNKGKKGGRGANGSADKLEGKIVSKVAVKVEDIKNEAEAKKINQELENAIQGVVETYGDKIEMSFVDVVGEWRAFQKKQQELEKKEQEKKEQKTQSLVKEFEGLSDDELASMSPAQLSQLKKLQTRLNALN